MAIHSDFKFLDNKIYTKVKDNISIILLLPAFLGGVWQVLELSRISTAFIRFFSVTQLVADGILILFILIFIYFGLQIVKSLIKDVPPIDLQNPDMIYLKRRRIANILLIVLSGGTISYLVVPSLSETIHTEKLHPLLFLTVIPVTIILTFAFIKGFIDLRLSFVRKTPKRSNKVLKELVKPVIVVLVIFAIIKFCLFFSSAFHKTFLLPENVMNSSYIKCKIGKNSNLSSNPEILYFNDKYIFIEYKIHDSTKIEILPFDRFFENDSCDSISVNNERH